jgi:hypothetical protein
MTNRIDYYQPELSDLSLPASSVVVYLDGEVTTLLEPVEITRSFWPEFSTAKLHFKPDACDLACAIVTDGIEEMFGFGKLLSIRALYNAGVPDSQMEDYPVFSGHIDCLHTEISGDSYVIEVIAKDSLASLRQIRVFGKRTAKKDGDNVFMPGLDTIFNPNGLPNASTNIIENAGRSYRVFSQSDGEGRLFSQADAIDYLLAEYIPAGLLIIPPKKRLDNLTKGRILADIDVSGLDLVDALHRCFEGTDINFYVEPAWEQNASADTIVFTKNNTGRRIRLSTQRSGEILSLSKTSFVSFACDRQCRAVTNRYIAFGEYKVYESTFDLIKAWDSGLENDIYELFCPSLNPDFLTVKDVYRCWSLNETGWYSIPPYNCGDIYDFSDVFEGEDYLKKPRRFLSCLSCDNKGQSLGYFLEVSCDGGNSWHQYQGSFDVLTNQCGVRLNGDKLEEEIFNAAISNLLRVRITASVVSDQRLIVSCADGSLESTCPVNEHILKLPGRYSYNKVCSESVFSATDAGIAGNIDDTQRLYSALRDMAGVRRQAVDAINIRTPFLEYGYQVGDIIEASPDGSDILNLRYEAAVGTSIEKVQMDFKRQCTHIKIARMKNTVL